MLSANAGIELPCVPVGVLDRAYAAFIAIRDASGAALSLRASRTATDPQLAAAFHGVMTRFDGIVDPIVLSLRVTFVDFRLSDRRLRRMPAFRGIDDEAFRTAVIEAGAKVAMTVDEYDQASFLDMLWASLVETAGDR